MHVIAIEPAIKSDFEKIKRLLLENDLPVEDINDQAVRLYVAKTNGNFAGVIGLESYGSAGLLRSLAVREQYKNSHIGSRLVNHILHISNKSEIRELYLLTTTAGKYFEKFDFTEIERESVPGSIKKTKEFADACPATAHVMKKEL